MKKWCFLFLLYACNILNAQSVKENIAQAIAQMEADPQLGHAIIGLCVVDTKTGSPVYEHNAQTGLAPASTQKLFTSCAAFDLLGRDYRYQTVFGYNNVNNHSARGCFVIKPSGDPSFGSSRFGSTKPVAILENIVAAVRREKIKPVSNSYRIIDTAFGNNLIPGGWIWEDIGNYYGAPAHQFNWLENQYDIVLKSGKNLGDPVSIVAIKPLEVQANLVDRVKSAEKGSGDNTVVYLSDASGLSLIEGTIPVEADSFTVSASIANPEDVFMRQLNRTMKEDGIAINDIDNRHPRLALLADSLSDYIELYRHFSPPLDSLNYWFLKKSINLYGEALIKTMAFEKSGFGSTEKGVELLKDFWMRQGIEKSALHIYDGSGLSPQNRVSPRALVQALQYARTRPWFSSFYDALPVYNGIKMKSGSINGARAFAGYHTAKDGREYSFAIMVNNYDGSPAAVIKKMYRLLDNLK